MKARGIFILLSILIIGIVGLVYPFWNNVLWFMLVFGPLILVGYFDIFQRKHSIRRNFPVIGNLRFILESIRPEIMRSEEHTSELQSRPHLVCRLLLEKK